MVVSRKIDNSEQAANASSTNNKEANSRKLMMKQKLNLIIVLLAISTISVLIISALAEASYLS